MITREIKIGNLSLGGNNSVRVQAMVKGSLDNLDELAREAENLVRSGAELIRCAIPEKKYAKSVYGVLKELGVPLIADCHFQSAIAIEAIEAGFDKVRVNPGNMTEKGIEEAVEIAKKYNIALRFGFNSGSCKADSGLDLAKLALEMDEKIKNLDFCNFVVSMKSSSVRDTVDANRYFSMHSDTPLHIGVTATGPRYDGIMKSAMGLGALLLDNVGDTIRVSLTGDSLEEIRVGCFLRDLAEGEQSGLETVSCPTCSRARIDVEQLVDTFLKRLTPEDFKTPYKVAIMGCEVNGPGEAKACDIGVCGTKKGGLFIKKGAVISSIPSGEIIDTLLKELRNR